MSTREIEFLNTWGERRQKGKMAFILRATAIAALAGLVFGLIMACLMGPKAHVNDLSPTVYAFAQAIGMRLFVVLICTVIFAVGMGPSMGNMGWNANQGHYDRLVLKQYQASLPGLTRPPTVQPRWGELLLLLGVAGAAVLGYQHRDSIGSLSADSIKSYLVQLYMRDKNTNFVNEDAKVDRYVTMINAIDSILERTYQTLEKGDSSCYERGFPCTMLPYRYATDIRTDVLQLQAIARSKPAMPMIDSAALATVDTLLVALPVFDELNEYISRKTYLTDKSIRGKALLNQIASRREIYDQTESVFIQALDAKTIANQNRHLAEARKEGDSLTVYTITAVQYSQLLAEEVPQLVEEGEDSNLTVRQARLYSTKLAQLSLKLKAESQSLKHSSSQRETLKSLAITTHEFAQKSTELLADPTRQPDWDAYTNLYNSVIWSYNQTTDYL